MGEPGLPPRRPSRLGAPKLPMSFPCFLGVLYTAFLAQRVIASRGLLSSSSNLSAVAEIGSQGKHMRSKVDSHGPCGRTSGLIWRQPGLAATFVIDRLHGCQSDEHILNLTRRSLCLPTL
jgi:hypothetical protein